MKADNETVRRAFDEQAAGTRRADRGCPELELLQRLFSRETSAAERRTFAEHLLVCPDCTAEYRLALPLEDFATQAAALSGEREPKVTGPAAAAAPRFAWAAVAAALVIAFGLSTAWLLSRRHLEDVAPQERGASAPTSAVVPPDGSVLAEPPMKLAWTAVEGAESYQVVLYDAESTPVWEAPPLREAEAGLPEAVRDRLRGGGNFYWRVVALRRAERLSSGLHRFSLRPAGRPGG